MLPDKWRGYRSAVLTDPAGVASVLNAATVLGIDRAELAWAVERESGWNPRAKNPDPPKGTGASGLIGFLPSTQRLLSMPDPMTLSRTAQAPYVAKYLAPDAKQFKRPGDLYLSIAGGPSILSRDDASIVGGVGSKVWGQNPAWLPADGGPVTVGSIRAYGTPDSPLPSDPGKAVPASAGPSSGIMVAGIAIVGAGILGGVVLLKRPRSVL